MPSSESAGKKKIAKFMNSYLVEVFNKTGRIPVTLDIGCGKGIYGKLITCDCYKLAIDGMDYWDKFGLKRYYANFWQKDMRDIAFIRELAKRTGGFDLVTMGDVLEHVTYREAREVLDCLEDVSKMILVAVPYLYPQDWENNPWEKHWQDDLTPEVFRVRYPEFELYSLHKRRNGTPFYGYYIWRKQDGKDGATAD